MKTSAANAHRIWRSQEIDRRVDFALLDSMRGSLSRIATRFEQLGGRIAAEDGNWGGSHVRSAMDEFALIDVFDAIMTTFRWV